MQLLETQQTGKRESLADLIAVAESSKTPYTSMIAKRKRPDQMDHSWQMKGYRVASHAGVIDGVDASSFNATPRSRVHCYAQKAWDPVAVSDLAEEATVAGVASEMAAQIEDSFVVTKQILERRCLSNNDTLQEDAPNNGYETRGIFQWLNPNAQTTFPVPSQFRPSSTQIYSSTLAAFGETDLITMANAAAKKRKGPTTIDGFVGLDLKQKINDFTRYDVTVGSSTNVARFNQDANDKQVINCVDRLVLDSGIVRLHPSFFLYTNSSDGSNSSNTDKSGVFIDMDMVGLAYTRLPRVFKLPYQGGGWRAVTDAIFLHMVDNPLGMYAATIAS